MPATLPHRPPFSRPACGPRPVAQIAHPAPIFSSGRILPYNPATMRTFDSLSEQEILALAIGQEEQDARIYGDFAEGLKENFPATAEMFRSMQVEEDGHRRRLFELYRQKFGEHIPLIRREDVKGFIKRKPVWMNRPLGLDVVRKQAC